MSRFHQGHLHIGRRNVMASAAAFLASPSIVRAQGVNGVALVIGNSKYVWEAPLPNVRRDAPDVAQHLQGLGLKVELLQDVGRGAMEEAIGRFATSARSAQFAAFYFAGHGVAAAKDSYVVPLDADLSAANFMANLIPVQSIFAAMKGAAYRLAVFDACRNNPAGGAQQLETERAAVQSAEMLANQAARNPNMVTLFSTAPGYPALDGPAGQNSPFASALLRQLDRPPIDMSRLSDVLRRELLISTQGQQISWGITSYTQSFALKAPANRPQGSRSSLSFDPSKVIELPKAYAFARANELPLPAGLIAYRPSANAQNERLVGSFSTQFLFKGTRSPAVMIVTSADEKRTAQIITASVSETRYWRYMTATVSRNKLEVIPRQGAPRFIFEWSDANSGTVTQTFQATGLPQDRSGGGGFQGLQGGGRAQSRRGGGPPSGSQGGGGSGPYRAQFTRLDG
jgi:hypothetical protein